MKVWLSDGKVVPALLTTICADFEPKNGEVVVAVKAAEPFPCEVVQPVKSDSKPGLVKICACAAPAPSEKDRENGQSAAMEMMLSALENGAGERQGD